VYNILSIGRASLFVMPHLFCHADISQTIAPGCVLGITGKLSMQRWGCTEVILEWLEFRPQMEELFNFDYFHN
jgi:hypothetical protein